MKYKIVFEFINGSGLWGNDFLDNNGEGFTGEDAKNVSLHLKYDDVCIKRNVKIEILKQY